LFKDSIAGLIKTLTMRESGLLDIINSIAVFQLIFSLYTYSSKGIRSHPLFSENSSYLPAPFIHQLSVLHQGISDT